MKDGLFSYWQTIVIILSIAEHRRVSHIEVSTAENENLRLRGMTFNGYQAVNFRPLLVMMLKFYSI
jgi:hypothetical protein